MKEKEEEVGEVWLVVAWRGWAVISTVFKWECFQWRGRQHSDSFDKCQEDSQGRQGGDTHGRGGGGGRKSFAGVLFVV